ncbi:hypothetical protein VIGAN_04039700 [Vigna angularis var. angularis]|uniref:Uncharacterized protein n=1 Tax=Vigna angularis var. angularis TaxID=157739 RepID=A0A0S3RRM7_PHAAN|nr:hypothetical protein VIGAN_04039700 [Vigna angularis var. angularis]
MSVIGPLKVGTASLFRGVASESWAQVHILFCFQIRNPEAFLFPFCFLRSKAISLLFLAFRVKPPDTSSFFFFPQPLQSQQYHRR